MRDELAARRRQTAVAERSVVVRDVRDELRGVATMLTACCTALENHARIPEVERQLMAAAAMVEGTIALVERAL